MTRGRLVVVTGTGTEIGKTHVAEALLLALGKRLRVAGVKPVESGVGDGLTDAERLRRASSFHVKHSGVALKAPISPHLAARQEGVQLDLPLLAAGIASVRDETDVLLAELPGGLFTPLTDEQLNADFALLLQPDFLLLLAPDRLGVLHDAQAAVRAAQALGLRVDGVALITPAQPDASTSTNGPELSRLLPVSVLATIPRAAPAVLAEGVAIGAIARALLA